jgi:hypothetical protein
MSEAIANRGNSALARPSFIKDGDTRGTENIGSADIRPPALRIAQSTSPEVKRTEAVYIKDLREGEFFNSITREVFGEGPLHLVIVNQLGHRHIEFEPGNSGQVVDFNVPDGDPRTEFTTSVVDGKQVRVKPRATKFYDYLVFAIPGDGRRILMTVSLKSTQLKKAVQLNTILKGSKLPSFAHLFSVTAAPEKRGGNSFYGWRFDPAGWVTEDVYKDASDQYDRMKGKNVVVEVEAAADTEDDDDAPRGTSNPF